MITMREGRPLRRVAVLGGFKITRMADHTAALARVCETKQNFGSHINTKQSHENILRILIEMRGSIQL